MWQINFQLQVGYICNPAHTPSTTEPGAGGYILSERSWPVPLRLCVGALLASNSHNPNFLQTMKVTQLFALLGMASAECPNACSGHGTCGSKDSCACYQNYQGNDCSERTCYFGLAHVDSTSTPTASSPPLPTCWRPGDGGPWTAQTSSTRAPSRCGARAGAGA